MRSIVNHFEDYLGNIVHGWSVNDKGEELPFQVVKFAKGHFEGTHAFATLGLSNHLLKSQNTKKIIKQELILISRVDADENDLNLPGIIQQIGIEAINKKRAYLKGEVIGPRGPLINGSQMEALYVTNPVYFPEPFEVFYSEKGEAIVIVWLVPISYKEAVYINTHGFDAFEDQLQNYDPDLFDLYRNSIPVCDP